MFVLAIDVGIINLGLVVARVSRSAWRVEEVVHAELVDTTHMAHTVVHEDVCTLGHTKTHTDRLMHVLQERPWVSRCDVVLIERQPFQGHTDVQEVLFLLMRDRAVLVSPNALHKHFGMQTLPYEWRKLRVVELASPYLPPSRFPEYAVMERQHDVADAVCMVVFWVAVQGRDAGVEAAKQLQRQVAPVLADTTHVVAVSRFTARVQQFVYQKKSGETGTGSGAHKADAILPP
jgi:hypothetical protein